MDDIEHITKLNIENKLAKDRKLIKIWKPRALTVFGKIIVIKSLLISGFIHNLLSLPSPTDIVKSV